jgi:hypothetical protein
MRGKASALWDSRVGSLSNGPITYGLNGRQYVVAGVGTRIAAFVRNE